MPDDFKNRVRVRLYQLFVECGQCPTIAELAGDLQCDAASVAAAFKELAAAHVLVLQADSGEVLMASPLSAVPTPFVVETQAEIKSRSWYGNCIWDALGVVSMMKCDGRVLTSCGCCGESMIVSVGKDAVEAKPAGICDFSSPTRR